MSPRHRRVRRGFTLLEVLLVIGIIALLAAFVVPNLMKSSDEAKIGLAKGAVGPNGPISDALMRYRWHMGKYPDTDEGLKALFTRPSSVDERSGKWQGSYLKGDPQSLKDPWDQEYQYRFPGEADEEEFDLWSMGPDSKDNTEDDIVNWKRK